MIPIKQRPRSVFSLRGRCFSPGRSGSPSDQAENHSQGYGKGQDVQKAGEGLDGAAGGAGGVFVHGVFLPVFLCETRIAPCMYDKQDFQKSCTPKYFFSLRGGVCYTDTSIQANNRTSFDPLFADRRIEERCAFGRALQFQACPEPLLCAVRITHVFQAFPRRAVWSSDRKGYAGGERICRNHPIRS